MNQGIELVLKYFPNLEAEKFEKFEKLFPLYESWNEQINVISRKDLDSFNERHLLHSLGIAKVIDFKPGTKILDIGTGGGFPGIPLAIFFPEVNFTLVDSIGKKIKVVNEVAKALELENVQGIHERAEKIKDKFDFIVSRAVTAMPQFLPWVNGKFLKENKNKLKNGILYLKGGDLTEEMKTIKEKVTYYELKKVYEEEFFDTKKVVYLEINN
jgi:16S rRNA (guanine527-N7)-methyltransferase